jgi:hypothetical protein
MKLVHFTPDQLIEIATVFSLSLDKINLSSKEYATIRDGNVIKKGDSVWWRSSNGPELVISSKDNHWGNIKNYPDLYQLTEPKTEIIYLD